MKPRPLLDKIRRLKSAGIVPQSTIRHMPAWVECCRVLVEADTTWLLVQSGSKGGKHEPGQLVIDLPAERYVVEVFDIAGRQWISRESAAGGPLVAGLPCTGNDLAIRIRAIKQDVSTPNGLQS